MKKATVWNGEDLQGDWVISIKLDGVRALRQNGKWCSRRGKELFNLPDSEFTDVEVFTGSFKNSISATRTINGTKISKEALYSLDPLDSRLFIGVVSSPKVSNIQGLMQKAVNQGYEGLVLRQGDVWLKVKPTETYDVPITDIISGKGKFTGMMGALVTPMGKVGTGFTVDERQATWSLGDIIEVECMQLTEDGKFRHPRFIRTRPDKGGNS